MNTTGKIQNKGQVTIPTAIARQAGLEKGDLINFTFVRGKIIITPRLIIDRSKFPVADDYTPAQRRAINRGIAQSEKEYRAGKAFGPYATHEQFIADLHKAAGRKAGKAKTKRAGR